MPVLPLPPEFKIRQFAADLASFKNSSTLIKWVLIEKYESEFGKEDIPSQKVWFNNKKPYQSRADIEINDSSQGTW